MSLIIPANTLASGGYEVDNSCRFNDNDSAYMHKTCGSAFNTDRWTISLWFKRGNLGIDTRLISCDNDDGSNDDYIRFDSSDQMEFMIYEGSSIVGLLKPNMVFRDVSAWYHLVCVWDSANGTAGNRMRMYVNGTEVTSFETDTNPSEGVNASWGNTSHPIEVGRRGSANNQYFDGYMAEVAVCDGQAYAASDFGEFDEDSGIWKPIDVSGLTFGTSGFYLDFEDSANLGNDANGGTDFTEVNLTAIDQSTDTCTNNFATLNNLDGKFNAHMIFSDGNLTVDNGTTASLKGIARSTIGVSSGKWYFEAKLVTAGNYQVVGITDRPSLSNTDVMANGAYDYVYRSDGQKLNNDTSASYGNSWGANDIIGVALDIDNRKLYFSKNGTFQNSGDPTSGGTGTGAAYTIAAPSSTNHGFYFFGVADVTAANSPKFSANFGSPPYAISSGNTDGNGYGNFEYAVPSGYYALNTKNLAEYG